MGGDLQTIDQLEMGLDRDRVKGVRIPDLVQPAVVREGLRVVTAGEGSLSQDTAFHTRVKIVVLPASPLSEGWESGIQRDLVRPCSLKCVVSRLGRTRYFRFRPNTARFRGPVCSLRRQDGGELLCVLVGEVGWLRTSQCQSQSGP